MGTVPEELRKRAIREMQASFGFTEGVEANFDLTVEMAIKSHRNFLSNLPDLTVAPPIPLDNLRSLSPKRRTALVANMARSAANIEGAGANNRQFLIDAHRLRLGSLFAMDSRVSTKTADEIADWIIENVKE
jgi:hypothetical protein